MTTSVDLRILKGIESCMNRNPYHVEIQSMSCLALA
eukprot:CAMPEP_0116865256 /NCGR_PEP_ID=MMETSP0418-20121206/25308_1 /TAXON_ID=1158023 /ORGANISM="Astrosyne radiata, Strain 13vi08-1A" /LENGTH=35 /DNA_ID= /DNA_START= /DNA_END= /DNA_ORIENTATION=